MLISIVVPTLNRAVVLQKCLASLLAQDLDAEAYEILVIDNGSQDTTAQVVQVAQEQAPSYRLSYHYEPMPGLLSGRHRGAQEAHGEILVFVDDDIEAAPHWLSAIAQTFQDPTVQLVGGRNLPRYEVEPPDWLRWFWLDCPQGRFCCELSLLDFGDQVQDIDANYIFGLNFSIRRQALLDLGGFHPDSLPKHLQRFQGDGETGLTLKANQRGYRAIYQPQAVVWHQVPQARMTYRYFQQRSFFQGVCDSFTEIRKLEGLPETDRAPSLQERVQFWIEDLERHFFVESDQEPEASVLKARFRQSFAAGFRFHRNAIRRDPQLLAWVLRPDYWDYRLPGF
ncbi:glycosyltransferase family 2 protein [Synechocystis sp. LKSZ1]|uniref:glycosyltransferase n=1 Tax=Synechocystis sp. LKSZ1 TaxID=3144951 RepID=UPI00336BE758